MLQLRGDVLARYAVNTKLHIATRKHQNTPTLITAKWVQNVKYIETGDWQTYEAATGMQANISS